mgnify:CR=1 FL=1
MKATDPNDAVVDRLDSDLAEDEKRFTALMVSFRDAGEDPQAVLDSLPRAASRAPFSAYRWLRTGLSGVPRTSGGLTVLRLTCDALEARQRGVKPTPAKRRGVAPAWDRGEDLQVTEADTAWDERLGPRPVASGGDSVRQGAA